MVRLFCGLELRRVAHHRRHCVPARQQLLQNAASDHARRAVQDNSHSVLLIGLLASSLRIDDTTLDMIENIQAIGFVEAARRIAEDDFWGGEAASIRLTEPFTAEALEGITDFSHVEVLFVFHEVEPASIVTGARYPRNNQNWPSVGIFAQRGKNRPNRIGSTICRVVRAEGVRLFVLELDAIDGTPVLDIKPVMAEFLPRQPVRQPAWSHELMRDYWALARQRGRPGDN